MEYNNQNDNIAIIGYAFDFPNGIDDGNKLWEVLEAGKDVIREIPEDRWDWEKIYDKDPNAEGKSYSYHGAFLDNIRKFDPNAFKIMPRECDNIDPQQRIVLKTAWKAMENSFLDIEGLKQSNTGVFIGATMDDYLQLQTRLDTGRHINRYTHLGSVLNSIAGRVSYVYGFHGPSMTIDTACSSSLVAIDAAMKAISDGDCDIALAGGINVILTEEMYIKFSRTQMLSKTGKCRSFSHDADGYVRGEGCGILVLQKLSEAKRTGKKIIAVIKGSYTNHNGNSIGFTAPSGKAQEYLIRNCMRKAGVSIEDLDYIEAHGTGTQLGDKLEVKALQEIFKERKQPLTIGSVKTNLGHLESAAGIAGVIKVLLCMKNNKIVSTINLTEKNPNIDWEHSIVKVVEHNMDWNNQIKIAGVSSFGASGTNAHIILQKYIDDELCDNDYSEYPLMLAVSAKCKESLYHLLFNLYEHIKGKNKEEIRKICETYNWCRSHYAERKVVVGKTVEDFLENFKYILENPVSNQEKTILTKSYLNGNHIHNMGSCNFINRNHQRYQELIDDIKDKYKIDELDGTLKKGAQEIIFACAFYKYIIGIGLQKINIIGDERVKLELALAEDKIAKDEWKAIFSFEKDKKQISEYLNHISFEKLIYEESDDIQEDNFDENLQEWIIHKAVEQYQAGININWNLLYNPFHIEVEQLPTYVFHEQEYWLEHQHHLLSDILGPNIFKEYIDSIGYEAKENEYIWKLQIKGNTRLVNQHIVNSQKILVGTFQIQLIKEFANYMGKERFAIENLIFLKKIQFLKAGMIQLSIQPLNNEVFEGKIESWNVQKCIWVKNTSFHLVKSSEYVMSEQIDSNFEAFKSIPVKELYNQLENAGLNLGNDYKVIDSINIIGDKRAVASLRVSKEVQAILDAASQLLYLFRNKGNNKLYLPYYFERYIQYGKIEVINRVEAELINNTNSEIIANLTYFSEESLVAEYKGYHMIEVSEKNNISDIVGSCKKLPSNADLYNYTINVIGTSLNDHAVYHRLTVPGAYFISQIMCITENEKKLQGYAIKDINFYHAVVLDETTKIEEIIQVDKEKRDWVVSIYSNLNGNENYTLNAKMTINTEDLKADYADTLILKHKGIHYSKEDILKIQRTIGLHLGETFHWMQELWVDNNLIQARLYNSKFHNLVHCYAIPPGLIDTSVQILGFIKNITQEYEGAYIPLNIGELTKFKDIQENMWCEAKLIRESGELIVGNISYYDFDKKHKILEIKEMTLIKADQQKLGKVEDKSNTLLFQEEWNLYKENQIENLCQIKEVLEFRFGINSKKIVLNTYEVYEEKCRISEKEVIDSFSENQIMQAIKSYLSRKGEKLIILSDSSIHNHIEQVGIDEVDENIYNLTIFYLKILKLIQITNHSGLKIWVMTEQAYNMQDKVIHTNYLASITWGIFRSIQREVFDYEIAIIDNNGNWKNNFINIFHCNNNGNNQLCIYEDDIYIPKVVPVSSNKNISNGFAVDSGKCHVVIGGLGALGYETCKMLLTNGAKNLIIIGKSTISKKKKRLDEISGKHTGCNIKYAQIDMTSSEALEQLKAVLIGENRSIGDIIYAAGIVVDKYHANYSDTDIESVYSAKIRATYILSRLLQEIEVDSCICYSSIVGVLGAEGQSLYGAANQFQDLMCNYMRSKGYNMYSVQWGPWGEVGMFTKVNQTGIERYKKRGIHSLTSEQAINGLKSVISMKENTIVAKMVVNKEDYDERIAISKVSNKKADFANGSTMDKVKQIVAVSIGVEEAKLLESNKKLLDMGVDSLLMVEIRSKINKELEVNLPLEMFFNNIDVQSIVNEIEECNKAEEEIVVGEI